MKPLIIINILIDPNNETKNIFEENFKQISESVDVRILFFYDILKPLSVTHIFGEKVTVIL